MNHRLLKRTLALLLLASTYRSVVAAPASSAPPVPQSMAALGDSMTAGLFANFKRQDFILPFSNLWAIFEIIDYLLQGKNIMRLERPYTLSWSTGLDRESDVLSHAGRIGHYWGSHRRIAVHNFAVSGAESQDIEDQVDAMRDWSYTHLGRRAPEYVTLLVGANDACGESIDEMTPVSRFQSNVRHNIQRILASDSRTKILVSSLPNIENLRNVAYNARLRLIPPFTRCYKLWEAANLCPTLTMLNTKRERNAVAARIIEYNDALREIVQEEAAIRGDRVRFAPKVYDVPFTKSDLSADCFHPNKYGQQMLSDATWKSTWWARLK